MTCVALVTNVLAHYRVECFRRLSSIPGVQVTYYVMASDMSHRRYVFASSAEGLDVRYLSGWSWHALPADDRHVNNLWPIIRGKYDVIIMGGWDEPTYLMTWLWGAITRKKIVFWIESTAYEGKRTRIKEIFKKTLIRLAIGCVVPGRRSLEYCASLGMPKEHIVVAPNAADREYFSAKAAQLLPQRAALRKQLGLDGVTVLFVGRLVESYKNVSVLVRAVGRMERDGIAVDLVLAGDGPDRAVYEKMVKDQDLMRVHILGELALDEVCRVYAAADILVLPSVSESWGFVLNEGMEFGLPIVASDAVGAGPDLVRDGENGFLFPRGDERALEDRLRRLVGDEPLRRRMGEGSRLMIRDFSSENWAIGMARAIENAIGTRP